MRPAKLTDAQALMLYAKAPLAIKQEFMDALAFVNVLRFFEKSYGIVETAMPAPALPSHALCAAIDDELEATAAEDAQPVAYTYSSTQATNCAGCGKHKHTPLRIDAMDGYVCLTCIDNKLGEVLGEFGYPAPQAPMTDMEKAGLVIEHLGPAALTGGKMSVLQAFELGIASAEAFHGITPTDTTDTLPPAAVAEGLERDSSSLEQAS